MTTIRINGEALELPINQSVQMVLNTSLFFGGSGASIPGSYSFPFDVDLTPSNRRRLQNPDLLDSNQLALINEPCTILIGDQVRSGTLGIKRVVGSVAKSFVILDELSILSTTMLTDLDLGGDRELTPAIAEALVDDMPNSDFVLIPMDGLPEDLEDPGNTLYAPSINEHNGFEYSTNCAVCPSIRLAYILERIGEKTQIDFRNAWQISDELKSIMLTPNRLAFDVEDSPSDTPSFSWPETINLNTFMPEMSCAEFIKRLRVTFNLAYKYNSIDSAFTIRPAKNTLNGNIYDWSNYVQGEPSSEFDTTRPKSIRFADSIGRFAFRSTFDQSIDIRPASARVYPAEYTLIKSENIIMRSNYRGLNTGSPYYVGVEEFHYSPEISIGEDEDNPLELPFRTLVDVRDILHQGGDYQYEEIIFRNTSSVQDVTISASTADLKLSLCFFRGRGDLQVGGSTFSNVPTGSVGDSLQDGTRIQYQGADVQHSLYLNGERGIYAQWHATWWEYLKRRRIVSMRFTLPVSVFGKYNDMGRIRVANQVYFPRQLKIRSSNNDRVVVDAEMISCF